MRVGFLVDCVRAPGVFLDDLQAAQGLAALGRRVSGLLVALGGRCCERYPAACGCERDRGGDRDESV
ncbi:MAG: hypothetical protein OXG37_10565 [Actinomycetia bacterium]|nr:hypothetical protein [Actinomycetes bacterium]